MFKCEWLKKLLGLKKECCCHPAQPVTNNQETATPAAPVSPESPVNQEYTEVSSVNNQ